MRSEEYVRPPIVAAEAGSPALARWRYRVLALLLLVVLVAAFVVLFLKIANPTGGEDPGLTNSLSQPRVR